MAEEREGAQTSPGGRNLSPTLLIVLHGVGVLLAARVLVEIQESLVHRELFFDRGETPVAIAQNLEALLLASGFAVARGLGSGIVASAGMCVGVYGFIVLASVAKMSLLETPLHPLDLLYLPDLLRAWRAVPTREGLILLSLIALAAVGVVGSLVRLGRAGSNPRAVRPWLILLGFAGALIIVTLPRTDAGSRALARGGVRSDDWQPIGSVRNHGVLMDLVLEIARYESPDLPGYDRESVLAVAQRRGLLGDADDAGPLAASPNVIVYMIESFADPRALGIRLTGDAIPNFRRLAREASSGEILSPVHGGQSADAEFELLTGMSMAALVTRHSPYKQWIKRDLPSLPRVFGSRGHRTIALHVASLSFFNYRQVYPHLGFELAETLYGTPGLERAASRHSIADSVLVDAILERAERIERMGEEGRFFLFAFANSTHSPWRVADYPGTDLRLASPQFEGKLRSRVEGWANSVRDADRALGTLIAHFEARDEPTVILILGDHLPPLEAAVYRSLWSGAPAKGTEGWLRRHRVPAVLWSNTGAPKRDFTLSLNLVGDRLLEEAGLEPQGFLGLHRTLRRELPILTEVVETPDGDVFGPSDPLPEALAALRSDYELLQYDVLHGDAYVERQGN